MKIELLKENWLPCLTHTDFVGSSGGCTVYSVPNLLLCSGKVIYKLTGHRAQLATAADSLRYRLCCTVTMADAVEATSKRKREPTRLDVRSMQSQLRLQQGLANKARAYLDNAQIVFRLEF